MWVREIGVNFNSTIVRLKLDPCTLGVVGSLHFNSTIVRLKLGGNVMTLREVIFQFYNSSIKTVLNM